MIYDPAGNYWIGEAPVYPGHPVTCALIVLRAYPEDVAKAWGQTEHGCYHCEAYLDTPTAGGNLSNGCWLIRHVLDGTMTIDQAIRWGDERWGGAGGHRDNEAPGQDQADRMKPALREELVRLVAATLARRSA